jgi:hypothetical protein
MNPGPLAAVETTGGRVGRGARESELCVGHGRSPRCPVGRVLLCKWLLRSARHSQTHKCSNAMRKHYSHPQLHRAQLLDHSKCPRPHPVSQPPGSDQFCRGLGKCYVNAASDLLSPWGEHSWNLLDTDT